jgi:hypothetical protein
MDYWILSSGPKGPGAETATSPKEAASRARALIRRGATAITILDETRQQIGLEDLERMLTAAKARSTGR